MRVYARGVKLLVILSVAMLVACACGGESAGRATTPAGGTPTPAAGDIASVVPAGWSIVQTWASSDGAYAALEMTGPQRGYSGTASRTSVSVYRRDDAGWREVARADAGSWTESIDVRPAGGALDKDASGSRTITIAFGDGNAPGSSATITIRGDGSIDVEGAGSMPNGTPIAASDTVPPDPLATVQTERAYPVVTPAVTVRAPAGAVPAGWVLSDAAWSPDGRYVAVETAPIAPSGFVSQLSLYRIEHEGVREIWREVNGFVRIDQDLAFRDVNGDGTPELVYETSSGGNGWTQSATLALTIDADGTAHDLTFKLPDWPSAPARAIDINRDGLYEWAVGDASWELRGFCHACSPGSWTVLAWDGSAYSDASARFGDWIVAQGQEPQVPAGTSCRAQDAYMSQLVSRFLDYTNAHRGSDAARVVDTLSSFAWSPEFTAKRDAIVAALRLDPHHPGDIPDVSCQD